MLVSGFNLLGRLKVEISYRQYYGYFRNIKHGHRSMSFVLTMNVDGVRYLGRLRGGVGRISVEEP